MSKGRSTINLIIPPSLLKEFKRRALKSDKEVFAVLLGEVWMKSNVVVKVEVKEMFYPPVPATENDVVVPTPAEMEAIEQVFSPLVVVGTLHSHPNVEGVEVSGPTHADFEALGGEEYGVVMGVYEFFAHQPGRRRRKSKLAWFLGGKKITVASR